LRDICDAAQHLLYHQRHHHVPDGMSPARPGSSHEAKNRHDGSRLQFEDDVVNLKIQNCGFGKTE
jgi:hypothetical protein